MSNELVPMDQLDRMATVFAKSRMFGAKEPEQVMALLLLAQAEGIHPATAMRDFDVIQGRPAKKAEAMLRSFIAAGGKVEWHAMTDTLADATFSHPSGGSARISWDMARAKQAGLTDKDMYRKYPRQMLANRCISEGCRRIYPASTSGLYVPEEIRQMVNEPAVKEKDMGAAQIVDDAPTERAAGGADNASPSSDAATSAPTYITPDQHIDLTDRLRDGGIPAERALKAWKVESVAKLGADQYDRARSWIAAAVEKSLQR